MGEWKQTESQRQIHWFEPSDVAVGIIGDLSLELLVISCLMSSIHYMTSSYVTAGVGFISVEKPTKPV